MQMGYIKNLAVMVLCALVWMLAVLVMAPVYLIKWIGRHILWIIAAVGFVIFMVYWFWRICTEPFG